MTVKVELLKKVDDSYSINFVDSIEEIGKRICRSNFGKKYCIIADSRVSELYSKELLKEINRKKKCEIIEFGSGEKSKSLGNVEKILDSMLAKKIERGDCVIALGGGVAGDLAGFCSAIYLRGINFIHVPTSLLAMVDSSIGGKTGVNLNGGKNTCGAFKQPKEVIIFTGFLKSLSDREFRNGLAEILKHAIIFDRKMFFYLKKNRLKIFDMCDETVSGLIRRNCEIKRDVVIRDEEESNFRRVLNFGHTIGHALESLSGYKITHGEAVGMGMIAETRIAVNAGILEKEDAEEIESLLNDYGFVFKKKFEVTKVFEKTLVDKKVVSGKVLYSLPKSIGVMYCKSGVYGVAVRKRTVFESLRGLE